MNPYLTAHILGVETLSRKAGATLATAGSKNAAAGASAHPQPKTVGLCPAAGVGLEGALHNSPRGQAVTAVPQ